jgi:uncharacterized protein (UPF0335 family)
VSDDVMRSYLPRAIATWRTVLEASEDFKDLRMEMKSQGLDDLQVAAICKAAKRASWGEKRREREEAIGQLVLQLEMPALREAAD